MMPWPEAFTTPSLIARRIALEDLAFAQDLMARPEMNAHKPDPTPPSADAVAKALAADLSHWQTHGIGRYLVTLQHAPIGLCGLTHRAGAPGLNLSYHLSPDHWGNGHASALVAALVHMADDHPDARLIYGLARPANPASARVLTKNGFTQDDDLILGGAPTTRYTRRIKAPEGL